MKTLKSTKLVALFLSLGLFLLASCKPQEALIEPDSSATEFITNGKQVTIKDHGQGTGTTTLTADKTWILDGMVFVNNGSTLTIEAGTIIKGKPGEGEAASALIVAKGAKITAIGTANKPIIFTALADDLNGSVAKTDRGLWGGVILLGYGQLNTTPSTLNIEGIPTTEPRGQYGGNDDNDNSGTLKYISIRHCGTNIGADNEINGLTLGGVGSQTTIEYIEVFASNDDGFEFFGGMPQTKYLISAYCKDDAFDYDQGYRGKAQFWLAVQDPETGDRLGEFDGADEPENGAPFAIPEIYNATFIGNDNAGKKTITFRANAGGKIFNSIVINQNKGVDIEIKEGSTTESSYKRLVSGDLKIENNIFFNIEDNTQTGVVKLNPDDAVSSAYLTTSTDFLGNYVANAKNTFDINPGISTPKISNWSPVPTADVTTNLAEYPSTFFKTVAYKGAFDPNAENWAKGWTLLFE